MKKLILIASLSAILVSAGCTFTVNVPATTVGETQTLTINEAIPTGASPAELTIEMGAGELFLSGGSDKWVTGTVDYNITEWKPLITRNENSLKIAPRSNQVWNIPTSKVVNKWDLKLGSLPMALTINAGAYKGAIDLTGLSITSLEINDGASEGKVRFDEPNPVEMDKLVYRTGASSISLIGLSNANFRKMTFDGGAGNYTLDFSGTLARDTEVTIKAGVSNVDLIIPADMNVKVEVNGGVNSIRPTGPWMVNGTTYSLENNGPLLTVVVDMGVGNLNLIQK